VTTGVIAPASPIMTPVKEVVPAGLDGLRNERAKVLAPVIVPATVRLPAKVADEVDGVPAPVMVRTSVEPAHRWIALLSPALPVSQDALVPMTTSSWPVVSVVEATWAPSKVRLLPVVTERPVPWPSAVEKPAAPLALRSAAWPIAVMPFSGRPPAR
jgi:hypothetical protein